MTSHRARREQRSRGNGRMTRLSRPWLESLEHRTLLSSVSWINPNGGDWDIASNWSTDAIPTALDNVTISIAVSNPITHGAVNADEVNSVTSDDPIVLSAGSVSIAAASTFSDTVTLSGGTLSGGPISLTDGATLVGTGSGGTLAGVTLDGTLDLATNNGANVTITGGLTLNGTIDLGNTSVSTYGRLNFVGAQTLGGTGSVVFGGPTGYIHNNQITTASNNGDSGTLTIGAGITIEGQYGSIGNSALPLINQGTIDANVSGGGISINGTNWSNSGTFQAANDGSLTLNGTWSSSGSITVSGGTIDVSGDWTDTGPISVDTGAVYLEGTSNLATDAGFSLGGSGGTVYFEGMLNDAGATLAANDSHLCPRRRHHRRRHVVSDQRCHLGGYLQ